MKILATKIFIKLNTIITDYKLKKKSFLSLQLKINENHNIHNFI